MQHGARGALAAEHRTLDRCRVAMVAAHEHAVAERDPLLGVKRRSLSGLTCGMTSVRRCSHSPVVEPNQRASCSHALALTVGSSASEPGTSAATRDTPAGAYDAVGSLEYPALDAVAGEILRTGKPGEACGDNHDIIHDNRQWSDPAHSSHAEALPRACARQYWMRSSTMSTRSGCGPSGAVTR